MRGRKLIIAVLLAVLLCSCFAGLGGAFSRCGGSLGGAEYSQDVCQRSGGWLREEYKPNDPLPRRRQW